MTDDANYGTDGTDSDNTTTDSNVSPESHASSPYKVLGALESTDGTGVLGHNTATSGAGSGVKGVSDSTNREAAGILGVANEDGSNGVAGYSLADTANKNLTPTSPGVFANSDMKPGPAVYGIHSSTSGVADGVAGSTYSPDGAGVRGFNNGGGPGVRSSAFLQVDSHVEISDLGASAYLSGNQSISEGSYSKVVFDATEADDRGEYDKGTGVYTCANDGDYHVDTHISYKFGNEDPVSGRYDLQVRVNSNIVMRDTVYYPGSSNTPTAAFMTLGGSKMLRNLSTNDEITVHAALFGTGTSLSLFPRKYDTYLTISQVG